MLEVLREVYGPPESTTDVESKVRTEEKRVSSVDQLLKTQQAEADLRASMLEVLNGVYGPPESTIHSAELQTVKTQVKGRHQAANHKKGLNYFWQLTFEQPTYFVASSIAGPAEEGSTLRTTALRVSLVGLLLIAQPSEELSPEEEAKRVSRAHEKWRRVAQQG